jgi:general secretion pathway protein C
MENLASQFSGWASRITAARGFVWLVNASALLLLTSGMAQWTWALLRPISPTPTILTPVHKATPPSGIDLDRLLTIELFGHSPDQTAASTAAPVSTLNLVLLGVVAAGGESLALISVDGNEQLPFAIGEEIAHGAVLDTVYPDRVIILRQGIRESLLLEDTSPSLPLSSVTPQSAAMPANAPGITELSPNRYRLDRTMLRSQVESPTLLSQALIVPHAKGGFQMRNVVPGSLYEKAGLHAGDIIKKVNGQSINTLDDVMRIYQEMGGFDRMAAVNVDIERRGKPLRLQYQLR